MAIACSPGEIDSGQRRRQQQDRFSRRRYHRRRRRCRDRRRRRGRIDVYAILVAACNFVVLRVEKPKLRNRERHLSYLRDLLNCACIDNSHRIL